MPAARFLSPRQMFDRLRQVRMFAFSAGDTITDAEALSMIRDLWLAEKAPPAPSPSTLGRLRVRSGSSASPRRGRP